MPSATWTLGFDKIETPEQLEEVHHYAKRLCAKITEDVEYASGHALTNAKDKARELHRLLVAMERYWR